MAGSQQTMISRRCGALARIAAAVLLVPVLVLATFVADTRAATSGPRHALVIGNASYADGEVLRQPLADARAIATQLRRGGFQVEVGENLTRDGMANAVSRFAARIERGSAALFFFSGYGIQADGQSYLIPVDARPASEKEAARDGVSVESILEQITAKGAQVKLIILDAARRNPIENRFRDTPAGLAALKLPTGTLATFAAAPGQVTEDGGSEHSLFVEHLLTAMQLPGLTAEQVFTNTRVAVARASNGAQVPWVSSTLTEDFAFVPAPALGAKTVAVPRPNSTPQPPGARPAPKPKAPAQALPEFPWPPPAASASYVLPKRLFEQSATVGRVADAILSALERNGYAERSFFRTAADGVALVTRLERINDDGSAPKEGERWPASLKAQGAAYDLAGFLRGLFYVDRGRYRVIVFILQDRPFSQSSQQVTEAQARAWLRTGANVLPSEVAARSFSDGTCTALIYEFASDGTAVRLVESQLTGRQHLEKAGVMALLENAPN
jgi:hypothetical protein